jgi:hypothetical protein
MQTHPKWKYHPERPEGLIVQDVEAEQRLGPGWVDSPNNLPKAELEVMPAAPGGFLSDVPGAPPKRRRRGAA